MLICIVTIVSTFLTILFNGDLISILLRNRYTLHESKIILLYIYKYIHICMHIYIYTHKICVHTLYILVRIEDHSFTHKYTPTVKKEVHIYCYDYCYILLIFISTIITYYTLYTVK